MVAVTASTSMFAPYGCKQESGNDDQAGKSDRNSPPPDFFCNHSDDEKAVEPEVSRHHKKEAEGGVEMQIAPVMATKAKKMEPMAAP